jgi:hypothetical protein
MAKTTEEQKRKRKGVILLALFGLGGFALTRSKTNNTLRSANIPIGYTSAPIQRFATGGGGTPAATAPAIPTNVVATPTAGSTNIAFTAVSGATGYTVMMATAAAGPFTTLATTATNGYNHTTGTAGTQYYYQVIANNAAGNSAASATVFATFQAAALPMPNTPTLNTNPVNNNTTSLQFTATAGETVTVRQNGTVIGTGVVPASGIVNITVALTAGASITATATNATGTSAATAPVVVGNAMGVPPNVAPTAYWKAVNVHEGYSFKASESAANMYMQPDRKAQVDEGAKNGGVGFDYMGIPVDPTEWFNSSGNLETVKLKVWLDYILTKYSKIVVQMPTQMFRSVNLTSDEVTSVLSINDRAVGHDGNPIDGNGSYWSGQKPSIFSSTYKTWATPRVQAVMNFLNTNYGSQIEKFDIWHGNTGEFYLEFGADNNGTLTQVGDYSQAALSNWRTWLNAKYGATIPAAHQGVYNAFTSSITTANCALPSVDLSAGIYDAISTTIATKGQVGKDWADWLGDGLFNHWKWCRDLIKATMPTASVSFFMSDFLTSQSVRWAFNSTAVKKIADVADEINVSDGFAGNGFNQSDFFEKYMPMAVVGGTWGYSKVGSFQSDPYDVNVNANNQAGTIGNFNVNLTGDYVYEGVRRGGKYWHTAMYNLAGINDAGNPTVNMYPLFKQVISYVNNKLTTMNTQLPNYATAPNVQVSMTPEIYGGDLNQKIKTAWTNAGGAATGTGGIVGIKLV